MMDVATSVGVRDLKNNLSRYLDRVRSGEEIIVTDRGRPVARLSSIDASTDRLADLVESGAIQPADVDRPASPDDDASRRSRP